MPIELPQDTREQALTSLKRYAEANFDEPLGNLAANSLLDFFLEEIGPCVYNKAVADVQARLQARIMDLDLEVHEAEFPYWQGPGKRR